MRKKIPEITESVETLKERLKQEKKARSKQRLHMLYLLKSGEAKTRKEVSALLAVHRHTVGHWLTHYETEGLERLLEIKTHPNRAYSLTPQMIEQLKEQLKSPTGFRSYTNFILNLAIMSCVSLALRLSKDNLWNISI